MLDRSTTNAVSLGRRSPVAVMGSVAAGSVIAGSISPMPTDAFKLVVVWDFRKPFESEL
jgi:hypothetical protein